MDIQVMVNWLVSADQVSLDNIPRSRLELIEATFFFNWPLNKWWFILSLNYKVQGHSVNKMLFEYKNKRKHDNVKYYKESCKLTW